MTEIGKVSLDLGILDIIVCKSSNIMLLYYCYTIDHIACLGFCVAKPKGCDVRSQYMAVKLQSFREHTA